MSETISTTKKRTRTPEQKARFNAYMREYRRSHPDAIREHRRRYILNAARRIEAEAEHGGGDPE